MFVAVKAAYFVGWGNPGITFESKRIGIERRRHGHELRQDPWPEKETGPLSLKAISGSKAPTNAWGMVMVLMPQAW